MRHSTDQLGALSVVKPSTNSKKRVWHRLNISLQSGRTVLLCALLLEPGHATDAQDMPVKNWAFCSPVNSPLTRSVENDSAIRAYVPNAYKKAKAWYLI